MEYRHEENDNKKQPVATSQKDEPENIFHRAIEMRKFQKLYGQPRTEKKTWEKIGENLRCLV